ncbi:MAG TPA: Ppx/GppA family phosphatase [Aestuariivirgaceae bacterium]|nr:Ppx/GppA family phosphatase [Aestuariivirgaceae bacterium]
MMAQTFRLEPPRFRPVAVVDVGSNSVRLVVYDGRRRAPSPVFNEKILCGLGRGVAITGELGAEAMDRALAALQRFRALCRQIEVTSVLAVATAAVREAANGPEFVVRAEVALGAKITVLTGSKEAELTALGVISAIPDADGIVGDLGGGSLELVDVRQGKIETAVTLPLGPLRLIDLSGGSMTRARRIVDETLDGCDVVAELRARDFYAVGGAWRNLARMHMEQNAHPLTILHHYRVPREDFRSVANLVAGLSPASLHAIRVVARSRAETLPYGAMVLERILARGKARDVVTSVFGVREGLIYASLSKGKREADPLLSACWDFARRYARSPAHERELIDWTDRIFGPGEGGGKGGGESDVERRLRHAACLLADISWRTSPDYRGSRAVTVISQAAFVGIDHPGRAFLALAVFFRYEGATSDDAPPDMMRLVDEAMLARARQLAAALRLAYVLTAAMPGVLPRIGIEDECGSTLRLKLPPSLADLQGEPVDKRLAQLAQLMNRTAELTLADATSPPAPSPPR